MLLASAADPSYGSRLGHVLLVLALCGLSARRGYVKALAFERSHGAGPRGWEPVSWSILCFSLLVIGHAMLGSALKQPPPRRTTEPPRPVHDPFSWGPPAVPAQAWPPPPFVGAPVAQDGSDAPGGSLPFRTSEQPAPEPAAAVPVGAEPVGAEPVAAVAGQVPGLVAPVDQVVVPAVAEPAVLMAAPIPPGPAAAPVVGAPVAQEGSDTPGGSLPFRTSEQPPEPVAAEPVAAPVSRRPAIDVLPGR